MVLIFVAAGLIVYAIAEFTEAGFLPVQPPLFDLTGVLPQSSPLGSVLTGLFGYRAAPSAHPGRRRTCCTSCRCCVIYLTDWRPSVRRGVVASA